LHFEKLVVPWLSHSAAGLPLQRPGFNPRPLHMGYVSKVTWDRFYSRVVGFFPVNMIQPIILTYRYPSVTDAI